MQVPGALASPFLREDQGERIMGKRRFAQECRKKFADERKRLRPFVGALSYGCTHEANVFRPEEPVKIIKELDQSKQKFAQELMEIVALDQAPLTAMDMTLNAIHTMLEKAGYTAASKNVPMSMYLCRQLAIEEKEDDDDDDSVITIPGIDYGESGDDDSVKTIIHSAE